MWLNLIWFQYFPTGSSQAQQVLHCYSVFLSLEQQWNIILLAGEKSFYSHINVCIIHMTWFLCHHTFLHAEGKIHPQPPITINKEKMFMFIVHLSNVCIIINSCVLLAEAI